MTRVALGRWTGRSASDGALRRLAARLRWPAVNEPWLRVAIAHVVVLLVADAALWSRQPADVATDPLLAGLAVTLGLAVLRMLTVRKPLAPSTLALDGVGTAILLAGTGGVGSPYSLLAVAGAWWAAHVPARHGALTYGTTFALAYLALVVPRAVTSGLLGEALEDAAVVLVVAMLSGWFAGRTTWSRELGSMASTFDPDAVSVREGLGRALRTMDVPVDAVLTAGRLGLTAVQTELVTYLMLGLTNAEIADAIGLSEAAVRYRLTRLYRLLGVRSRKGAADAARELGLTPLANATRNPRRDHSPR